MNSVSVILEVKICISKISKSDLETQCITGPFHLNKKLKAHYVARGPFYVPPPRSMFNTATGYILEWQIPITDKNFHCSRYYGSDVRITFSFLHADSPGTGCILAGMVLILPQSVTVALLGPHLD